MEKLIYIGIILCFLLWVIRVYNINYKLQIKIDGHWRTLGIFESNSCAEDYLEDYLKEFDPKFEDYRILKIKT